MNTTKHLDFLNFKEALEISSSLSQCLESRDKIEKIEKILELKNSMNKKRTNFTLPVYHIRITPYWLLGLIEGEGSFHLSRTKLVVGFSLSLTEVQRPVLESIIKYLESQLDKYSLVKASKTKLFNLSFEKAIENAKPKIKLSITQLDYLINIFIPFLETLVFKSKKKLDFDDFKFIATLIYQGKHLIPEIKSLILKVSYNMNNFRLSTNKIKNLELIEPNLNIKTEEPGAEKEYNSNITDFEREELLRQPAIHISNSEGERINVNTGKVIREVFVIEVEKTISSPNGSLEKEYTIYNSILDCSNSLGVSRPIIYTKIKNGTGLAGTNIDRIRKVPVFRKVEAV